MNRLGKPVADQYVRLKDALATGSIAWKERYRATRAEWRPFSHEGRSVGDILRQIVKELNQRGLPKLKHRQLKPQWYPFDALVGQADAMRQTYRDLARTGLIMVVDEVSLFHPDLREALQNSPFFNNDQVAMVTISPFDPGCAPLEQLLEHETRRKLAGAFDRYAVDYDPQCELAVGDERRLKRWLHASLPDDRARGAGRRPPGAGPGAWRGPRVRAGHRDRRRPHERGRPPSHGNPGDGARSCCCGTRRCSRPRRTSASTAPI